MVTQQILVLLFLVRIQVAQHERPLRNPGRFFVGRDSRPLRVPGRFFVGKAHVRFGFRGGFSLERFTAASGSGAVFRWEGSCPLRVPGRFFVGKAHVRFGFRGGFRWKGSYPLRVSERFFVGKIHGRFGFRGGFFVGKAHGRFRLRGGFLLEKLTAASGFGTFPALEKPRPYRTAAHIAHIPPPRTIIPNNPSPKKSGPARRLEPLVTFRNPVVSGPESIFRDPSSRSAPGFRVCGRGNAHRAPWDAPCRPFREYSPGTTQLPPD